MASAIQHPCPICGKALPSGSRGGMCPACLMRNAVEPGSTSDRSEVAQLGPYQLIEVLGEGGMGVVWLAEQSEPIQREVAVKVIKAGMDSREVLARFEAERQALALMDHPGIARVLDAGMTVAGRPFFVMELVEGLPVTDFCDGEKLSVRERLNLLLPICDAVQHAHQKGILHRDLKPSNILARRDADGKVRVKVIDFGIAKAVGTEAIVDTLVTQMGQVIGTPQYMSPEQASGDIHDIDTRSDVYALGILLYELLTGTTPLTAETVRHAALDEMLRRIRHHEPVRPSIRLGALDQAGGSSPTHLIAEARCTTVSRLRMALRGDLDWIALKALEREPERRYATANALAEDLRRHLDDEPVLARPPSAAYRLKKTFRRHRTAFVASAAVVMALVTATVISLRMAYRATAAQKLANERLADAEAVPEFLIRALRSPDPSLDGRDVRVVDVLDQAVTEARDQFASQPVIRARLIEAIAHTYNGLGLFDQGAELLEEVSSAYDESDLGETREAFRARTAQAVAARFHGDYETAARENLETWRKARDELGLDHKETVHALFEYTLCIIVLGRHEEATQILTDVEEWIDPSSERRFILLTDLGMLLREEAGDLEPLVPFYTRRVQRGIYCGLDSDNENVASQMEHLTRVLQKLGREREAEVLREEALWHAWSALGSGHSHTIYAAAQLAQSLATQNRHLETAFMVESLLTMCREAKLTSSHTSDLQKMATEARAQLNELESQRLTALLAISPNDASPKEWASLLPANAGSLLWTTSLLQMAPTVNESQKTEWLEHALSAQQQDSRGELWSSFGSALRLALWHLDHERSSEARTLLQPYLNANQIADHPLSSLLVGNAARIVDGLPAHQALDVRIGLLRLGADAGWMMAPEIRDTHMDLQDACGALSREDLSVQVTDLSLQALGGRNWPPNPLHPRLAQTFATQLIRAGREDLAHSHLEKMLSKINTSYARTIPPFRSMYSQMVGMLAAMDGGQKWTAPFNDLINQQLRDLESALSNNDSTSVTDIASSLLSVLKDALRTQPSLLVRCGKVGHALKAAQHRSLATSWLELLVIRLDSTPDVDESVQLEICSDLASLLQAQNRYQEAHDLVIKLIALSTKIHGETHSNTIGRQLQLSVCLIELGRNDESVLAARNCVATATKSVGAGDPLTLNAREQLIDRLARDQQFSEALKESAIQLDHARKLPPSQQGYFYKTLAREGNFLRALGRPVEAEQRYSRVISECPKTTSKSQTNNRFQTALNTAVQGMGVLKSSLGEDYEPPEALLRYIKSK